MSGATLALSLDLYTTVGAVALMAGLYLALGSESASRVTKKLRDTVKSDPSQPEPASVTTIDAGAAVDGDPASVVIAPGDKPPVAVAAWARAIHRVSENPDFTVQHLLSGSSLDDTKTAYIEYLESVILPNDEET